jgi:exoribonuclease-2
MNPRHPIHLDLRAVATTAAAQNGFITEWTSDSFQQIKALRKSTPEEAKSSKQLTDVMWSSIDNNDSKDLDQIEYAERLDNGDVRILVGIADVDAYVPKGSPIDLHAAANTTSVYTGAVIFPMLPDDLSSDMTSLKQDEERAAIVIELIVAQDGTVKSSEFYRGSVQNKAKLAYSAVGRWLEGDADRYSKDVAIDGLEHQLKLQAQESGKFHETRARTGSLNLYTIEAQPIVVDGQVVDISVVDQNPARELIENFMVAANTAMAKFLDKSGSLSIRRIVKTPKRWSRIVELADQYDFKLPSEPDGHALNLFLAKRKLADPVHFPDLSLSVVKLLGRGEYIVVRSGQSHEGHFGLGIQDYTHSTAPNRRYADLITQRLVKAIIDGKPSPYTEQELDDIAKHCTEREDAANRVERFMRKVAAALLLSGSIGESFEAIVTGVKEDGTYVRLLKPPAEGRIVQNEHGLDVGDKVHVRLLSVKPAKGFIDFRRI